MSRMRCLLPLALVLSTGCGAAAQNLSERATTGAVKGGVDTVTDRDTQEQIVGSIDDKLVSEATDRLVSGVIDGSMRSLEDPTRRDEIREELGKLLGGVKLPLTIDRVSGLGPVFDEMMVGLSKPQNQTMLRALVRDVMSEAISGAAEQTRTELEGIDTASFSPIARELTKQAALGIQDAVEEAQQRKDSGGQPADKGNVLAAAGEAAEEGSSILTLSIVGLGGFGLALLLTILWASRKQRGLLKELHRRDDALLGLIASMSGKSERPTFGELENALDTVMKKRPAKTDLAPHSGH